MTTREELRHEEDLRRDRRDSARLGPREQPVSMRIRVPLSGLVVAAALAPCVTPAAGATAAPPANRIPGTIAFSGVQASGASPVSQIYEAHPDGSVRQLTHDRRGLVAAAWSPDGSRLVAFRLESPRRTALYVVRGDGSLGPRLTSAVDGEPRWSPDGRRVAYKLGRAIIVDFASGRGRRLIVHTGLPATAAPDVTWAPDGSRIAFAGAIRGRQGLFAATLPEGPGQVQVQLLVPLPARSRARPHGHRPARRSPTRARASGWCEPTDRTDARCEVGLLAGLVAGRLASGVRHPTRQRGRERRWPRVPAPTRMHLLGRHLPRLRSATQLVAGRDGGGVLGRCRTQPRWRHLPREDRRARRGTRRAITTRHLRPAALAAARRQLKRVTPDRPGIRGYPASGGPGLSRVAFIIPSHPERTPMSTDRLQRLLQAG